MRIRTLKPLPEHRLWVEFSDGAHGTVDLSAKVGTGVFAAWQDGTLFRQVRIGEFGQAVWPGDIDLCPDMLYQQVTGRLPAERVPKAEPSHA